MSYKSYRSFIYIYLLYYFATSTLCQAVVPLKKLPPNWTCPFMHTDSYSNKMTQLNFIIENQIKTKIDGTDKCTTLFNNMSQNLSIINSLMDSNKNPTLYEEIKEEMLSKRLLQLKIDSLLNPKNVNNIENKILQFEDNIFKTKVDRMYKQDLFKERKINETVNQTFEHLYSTVEALTNADSECIDKLGGWEQILPTVLSSMASASGLAGYAYGAFIGSGLQLLASLTILLRDYGVRSAFKRMLEHKNSKILACLYFSVQSTACEYRRALVYSSKKDEIQELIDRKYEKAETKIYDEFFSLAENSHDFEKIFFDIATMGSAITLDVGLIAKYFVARRASPETILNEDDLGLPPDENDDSQQANERRQSWLIQVKTRGINFIEKSPLGIRPLKSQIKDALADISTKIADIKAVEKILTGTRSFVDLKHELNTNPRLLNKVMFFINYFKRVQEGKIVNTVHQGIIVSAISILRKLEDFLSINLNQFTNNNELLMSRE
ncbi:MAG: hypothetical protein CMP11_06670, partial [Zetaproteobacteria bacterium]|nr:hypothetical protein [Pseudobdellovibrionaceae bacterium]